MRVLDGRLFDLRPSAAATASVEPLSSTATVAPQPREPASTLVSEAGEIQPRAPAERTTAVKQGDPEHTGGDRPTRRRSSRRLAWVGAAVGALAIAAAVVALVGGAGGSGAGSSSVSIISLTPQPAVTLSPSHGLTVVDARQTDAPGGYTYRLVLSRGNAPPASKPDTKVPYYFTLLARRGNHSFVTVQRIQLSYPFTADSAIADFEVGPNPDGSANVTLSWYRVRSDKTDITRCFDLTPAQISLG